MKAIDIFTDMGRFTVAAKHHQTIAEIYETEKVDLEQCIKHYEKAADFFRGEESTSSANKCQLKVAQYAAEMKDYEKAISIYDQVRLPAELDLREYRASQKFFNAHFFTPLALFFTLGPAGVIVPLLLCGQVCPRAEAMCSAAAGHF